MSTTRLIFALALAAAGLCAEAQVDCGPPPPPEPCGYWDCIFGDGSYRFIPYDVGSPGACPTGSVCDSQSRCVSPLATPVVSNIHMVSPAQVGYYHECGGGPTGPNTYTLQVSRNSGPWETLPDVCPFTGAGNRFDSLRVAPEQSRCYLATVSNPYGTRDSGVQCYTTPPDLVAPTPPSASVSPSLGSALIDFTDRSTNETEFRVYGRRANQDVSRIPSRWILPFEAESSTIIDDACMPAPEDLEVTMCTASRVERSVDFRYAGRYAIRVRLRAQPTPSGPPVLSFRLDGHEQDSMPVPGTTTTTVESMISTSAGRHSLALAFVNDEYDPANGIDRNLFMDSFTLEGPLPTDVPTTAIYEAEDGIILDLNADCRPKPGDTVVTLCNTSRIEQALAVPADGDYRIRVAVRPDSNVAGPPNLAIKVDGVTVASVDVPGETPTVVEVVTRIAAGPANGYSSRHTVTLAFTNDNNTYGDDRNLYVDSFTTEGPLFTSDWQRLCTWERFTSDHDLGFPHQGTGESHQCSMDNLTPGLDYEAKVEAYHPHAERTSAVVLPFQSLPPIPPPPQPRILQVTNDSVTIGWDPSQYASSYKVYRHGSSFVASITQTQYTQPGLQPNLSYCFDVAAVNVSGEAAYRGLCVTTHTDGPQPRVLVLDLNPLSTSRGVVLNVASPSIDGTLDSLELSAEDNPASFAGLITNYAVAHDPSSSQGCSLSAAGAVFLDADGALKGARLAALYGSEHPFLKSSPPVYIGGCSIFTAAQSPPPRVRIRLHYTGYAP